jgi:UDP-glucose 4-epimerase
MREELLIPIFIKKALQGQPLTISGKGSQYRNFIYVQDLAEAHVMAMSEKAINQTYNLEGPQKVTVLEVAEGIKKILGDHVNIEFVPERPGDFGGKEVSAEKARIELGWTPTVRFEEGLRRTVNWFQEKWQK